MILETLQQVYRILRPHLEELLSTSPNCLKHVLDVSTSSLVRLHTYTKIVRIVSVPFNLIYNEITPQGLAGIHRVSRVTHGNLNAILQPATSHAGKFTSSLLDLTLSPFGLTHILQNSSRITKNIIENRNFPYKARICT